MDESESRETSRHVDLLSFSLQRVSDVSACQLAALDINSDSDKIHRDIHHKYNLLATRKNIEKSPVSLFLPMREENARSYSVNASNNTITVSNYGHGKKVPVSSA